MIGRKRGTSVLATRPADTEEALSASAPAGLSPLPEPGPTPHKTKICLDSGWERLDVFERTESIQYKRRTIALVRPEPGPTRPTHTWPSSPLHPLLVPPVPDVPTVRIDLPEPTGEETHRPSFCPVRRPETSTPGGPLGYVVRGHVGSRSGCDRDQHSDPLLQPPTLVGVPRVRRRPRPVGVPRREWGPEVETGAAVEDREPPRAGTVSTPADTRVTRVRSRCHRYHYLPRSAHGPRRGPRLRAKG